MPVRKPIQLKNTNKMVLGIVTVSRGKPGHGKETISFSAAISLNAASGQRVRSYEIRRPLAETSEKFAERVVELISTMVSRQNMDLLILLERSEEHTSELQS